MAHCFVAQTLKSHRLVMTIDLKQIVTVSSSNHSPSPVIKLVQTLRTAYLDVTAVVQFDLESRRRHKIHNHRSRRHCSFQSTWMEDSVERTTVLFFFEHAVF